MELQEIMKFAGVLLILAIFAFGMETVSKSLEQKTKPQTIDLSPEPLCGNGETSSCASGNCAGIRTCRNGRWGDCTVKQICTPGTKTSCSENGCANGYKICNTCGTGFGTCTPNP
jgi:hypothetical protein